jgi:hypothetical protein
MLDSLASFFGAIDPATWVMVVITALYAVFFLRRSRSLASSKGTREGRVMIGAIDVGRNVTIDVGLKRSQSPVFSAREEKLINGLLVDHARDKAIERTARKAN